MAPPLPRTSLFQKLALLLTLIAVCTYIFSYHSGSSSTLDFVLLSLILCFIAFRKELLWRIRNRLLITSFLLSVVPVILITWALIITSELLLGHFAAQRVHQDLQARIETVRATAQNLTSAASHAVTPDLIAAIRQEPPNLSSVIHVNGDLLRSPQPGEFQSTPPWLAPGFSGLFESDGRYFIGAIVRDNATETFAYLPLDPQALSSLAPGIVSVSGVFPEQHLTTNFSFGPSGSQTSIIQNGVRQEILPSGLPSPRGWWDVPIAGMLPWQVQTPSGNAPVFLPLASRPSLLLAGDTTGRMTSVALSILFIGGGFFLILEAIALFSSFALSLAVTRSVDDLYQGTLQVGQGDFSHQIPVRGQHQLSELSTSFNTMTAKIRQLIGEVKKKEKLDAELEIAREVQSSLFPTSAPKLRTLQMAAVCIPGRVVSGDYYDYLRLDDRWTVVALGDVSGKGVSAALLVASIQSALHAQLKFGAASLRPHLSTANLMAAISQQLYENTPPEKYATFFCSLYDDETGRLAYTNAGHLKPILVREENVIRLEGGGMVAGLLPDVTYEQQDVLLQSGDLLAIFSDGIPEAMDRSQQEFGEARLADLLVAESSQPLDNIIAVVTAAVGKWIHDPEGRDDLTLLLLRKL